MSNESKRELRLNPGIEGNLPETPRLSDSFHAWANADWLRANTLPAGYSRWTTFAELNKTVEEQMFALLEMKNGTPLQKKAAALYHMALDHQARNENGFGPGITAAVEALRACKSVEDISRVLLTDINVFLGTGLLSCGPCPDDMDSSMNIVRINAPALSLMDSAEYTALTENGARRKAANAVYFPALLEMYGFGAEEAAKAWEDRFAFESALAPDCFEQKVSYREDYVSLIYNPRTREELDALSPDFPLTAMMDALGLGAADKYVLSEPKAAEAVSRLYNDDHLEQIRAYLITGLLSSVSVCTSAAAEDAVIARSNAISGSSGRTSDETRAYRLVDGLLSEMLGMVYASVYFDEASRQDVLSIVHDVIEAYKERLSAIDWLSPETRATAVRKLDTMSVRIGYPDVCSVDWNAVEVDPAKPLVEHVLAIRRLIWSAEAARAGKPVDRRLWLMPANMVNACYNPYDNSINFPAAILQGVFYNKDRAREANLGGVGMVIGHEISHAFDTTGSQYDLNGNRSNWWTDEDRAAFTARTDAVKERFAAIEVLPGEHVQGDFTIGETVADLGGMACMHHLMKRLPDPDYEILYRTYACVWREKITRETCSIALLRDPHAPNHLRTDITVQQFDEFYKTFPVEEGSAMYTAPENRLQVW